MNQHKEFSNQDMARDIISYISPYRKGFWVGRILTASASALWLIVPWVIGQIITFSANISENPSLEPLWEYLLIFSASVIYYYFAIEIARYLVYGIAEKSSVDLQLKTLNHVVDLDLHWHEDENSGSKLKRISRGGVSLNKLLRMFVNQFIDGTVSLIGVAIIFFALDWKLNLILVVFFIVHYILSLYLTPHRARRIENEYDF